MLVNVRLLRLRVDVKPDFHSTPISAERKSVTIYPLRGRLRILEPDGPLAQPGDGRAVAVEGGLAQDRVVRTLVEVHHYPLVLHLDHAAGFHEPAVQLLGLGLGEAAQATGEP